MTDEEENDLLLQVVQAFSVCEDNRDGIAADAGIAISLNGASSEMPMASVHFNTGGPTSLSSQANHRMHSAQGQGLAAVATQQVDTEAIKRSLADAHVPGIIHILSTLIVITHSLSSDPYLSQCTYSSTLF